MRVQSILAVAQKRMISVRDDASLVDAAYLLSGTHRALLVVCDEEGGMAGVITKTDVVRQVAQCPGVVEGKQVSEVMTHEVTSCEVDDQLHNVLSVMKERGFVHIPIVGKNSQPLGVVNTRDALQALLREVKDEELLIRAYVMGIGYH